MVRRGGDTATARGGGVAAWRGAVGSNDEFVVPSSVKAKL